MATAEIGTEHRSRTRTPQEVRGNRSGLKIESRFCPTSVSDPFDTTEWETRSAAIKDENGKVLFEQTNCQIPATWSQLATNVVVSKYFYGDPKNPKEREYSVKQLIHRVTRTIADWGLKDGYFDQPADAERFYRDLTWLCLHQYGSFNSPVWFNVGLFQAYNVVGTKCNWHFNVERGELEQPENPYEYPQASACFIQSVDDNMEDIMRLAASEAMLFKFGSGTGTDLSTIRSSRERLSGGGKPSGPLSFMRVYDQIAAVVKSGGKTRRAAKMQSIKVWHPDVMDFIECKWKEEQKAHALIREGYESNFNGEAYSSVMFQNANLSVRVTDEFMQAVRDDQVWSTRWISDKCKEEPPKYRAREVLNRMADCAWHCGDPGVQYDTTINKWHTCPNSGRINASNPCSEYMFLDDTACNLASMNLLTFFADGAFDAQAYIHATRLWTLTLEISVMMAQFPSKEIAQLSYDFRTLGLGYAYIGGLLMNMGLGYDSDAGRALCGALTALMTGVTYATSAEIAAELGPFAGYGRNAPHMLRVIRNHRRAAYGETKGYEALNVAPVPLDAANCPAPDLVTLARGAWDEALALGEQHGYRNAQTTVIAPTGTIGLVMDCDTTGIEPDFALVKFKKLAGGGYFKIINQSVPAALEKLGYSSGQIAEIVAYAVGHGTLGNCPGINHTALIGHGFGPREIEKIEAALPSAFDIRFVFNQWTLGEEFCKHTLGIPAEKLLDPTFDLLRHLGFTKAQIDAANDHVCGTMTLEGAPFLKAQHLPVFDCANPCG
ncbi:MAG: vitamin B12-dependent ribonucleotide reductase, partial [Pirellula sp.]